MNKYQQYQQYRKVKKLKKLLDAPGKQEEVYTPNENLYMTTESRGCWNDVLDVSQTLRLTQVETAARALLLEIARLRQWSSDTKHEIDEGLDCESERNLTDIRIMLEELDSGVLLTEAEKAARKTEQAERRNTIKFLGANLVEEAGSWRIQVESWQQELVRRKRKFYRIEGNIRDLSLNIHDVRCAQIRQDRRASAADLEVSVKIGIRLLKEIFVKAQSGYMSLVQEP